MLFMQSLACNNTSLINGFKKDNNSKSKANKRNNKNTETEGLDFARDWA